MEKDILNNPGIGGVLNGRGGFGFTDDMKDFEGELM